MELHKIFWDPKPSNVNKCKSIINNPFNWSCANVIFTNGTASNYETHKVFLKLWQPLFNLSTDISGKRISEVCKVRCYVIIKILSFSFSIRKYIWIFCIDCLPELTCLPLISQLSTMCLKLLIRDQFSFMSLLHPRLSVQNIHRSIVHKVRIYTILMHPSIKFIICIGRCNKARYHQNH